MRSVRKVEEITFMPAEGSKVENIDTRKVKCKINV